MVSIRKAFPAFRGLLALGLVGCSGGTVSPPPPAQPVTLSASPASIALTLFDIAPQPVSVKRSRGSFVSLALSISDPTSLGATVPLLDGSVATFGIIPIANNNALPTKTITATDSTGATASVSVTSAVCGRPPSLPAAQQVVPGTGATAVSTSIAKLFFVAYFAGINPIVNGNLHLIVGAHGTLEGGSLVAATPPPGTVMPTPIALPNTTAIIVSAAVPTLAAGQHYQTELYNDPCQLPVLAGTFST